jgi:predicted RNA-binding protein with PIN domain
MRTLIDGYNLLFAFGLPPRRLGPDGWRKVRTRFLNELAAGLGPIEAHQTVVVFDAHNPPSHLPSAMRHQGLTIVFAVGDENADERLERLIAEHSSPKNLTVVSSDHRVRQAAARRKARVESADSFWSRIQEPGPKQPAPPRLTAEELARQHGLSPEQSRAWLDVFAHVADEPENRDQLADDFVPSDEEIARIAREVEQEF